MNYIEFASKISFYEFLQDEFKKPHFDISKYNQEIKSISREINIDYLTKALEKHPKIIDLFEEILQLKRFTNTQYINFCFDVNILNNAEEDLIVDHINKAILNFENAKANENFQHIYRNTFSKEPKTRIETLFCIKRAIVKYVEQLLRRREILYDHIRNSIGTRLRISRYLIESLNADDLLKSIDLENFLKQKRHPKDTKGLHGNFGNIKIEKTLKESGLKDVTKYVNSSLHFNRKNQIDEKGWLYVREKTVVGINKRKDGKPKKFDYILIQDGLPKILIETNFYSTQGTKIGINQGEYVDLHEDIQDFNREHKVNLYFIWITDGNYWLSRDGESRFENLKTNFFKRDFEFLNYKLFQEALPKIQRLII